MAAKKTDDDASLKRLGGGRWQTRDERFTVEPESGTWVLVDAEQTDDLGLPLVRGPYKSLTDAKTAIADARATGPTASPLAERIDLAKKTRPGGEGQPSMKAARGGKARSAEETEADADADAEPEPEPKLPPEPRWIADLASRDRGRARRLVERLTEAGIRDAEGIVRQDLVGGVPTIARLALADHVAGLLSAADAKTPALERTLTRLVEALDDGRDEELEVRWRLVDGDDRPIGLTAAELRAAMKRRADAARKGSNR
jgi:hypothetical protein